MFERHNQPMISTKAFAVRMVSTVMIASGLVAFSLGIGMVGYHFFAGLEWLDSLLNSSMILTGMGPVSPMQASAAKVFASAYAVFSGVSFPTTIAILLTPVIHRLLHHIHLDIAEEAGS
jgi:hypothetical protein